MPETYYYATGTEVTSIADAIRTKGGTSSQLEFPDDFVQAIEDLHPEPTIAPLTVKPKEFQIKCPIGYEIVDCICVNEATGMDVFTVDLSSFSNGDSCYVKGTLYSLISGAGGYEMDMSGSFVWSSSNVYTKGVYTLNISSTSVTIYNSSGNETCGSINSEVGYRAIAFCKRINCDGFGPLTVEQIPESYVNVSNATATSSDIVSGKKAGVYRSGSGVITTGTLVIQHYYTGSTDPSSSLGVNGDIYLKT